MCDEYTFIPRNGCGAPILCCSSLASCAGSDEIHARNAPLIREYSSCYFAGTKFSRTFRLHRYLWSSNASTFFHKRIQSLDSYLRILGTIRFRKRLWTYEYRHKVTRYMKLYVLLSINHFHLQSGIGCSIAIGHRFAICFTRPSSTWATTPTITTILPCSCRCGTTSSTPIGNIDDLIRHYSPPISKISCSLDTTPG